MSSEIKSQLYEILQIKIPLLPRNMKKIDEFIQNNGLQLIKSLYLEDDITEDNKRNLTDKIQLYNNHYQRIIGWNAKLHNLFSYFFN